MFHSDLILFQAILDTVNRTIGTLVGGNRAQSRGQARPSAGYHQTFSLMTGEEVSMAWAWTQRTCWETPHQRANLLGSHYLRAKLHEYTKLVCCSGKRAQILRQLFDLHRLFSWYFHSFFPYILFSKTDISSVSLYCQLYFSQLKSHVDDALEATRHPKTHLYSRNLHNFQNFEWLRLFLKAEE